MIFCFNVTTYSSAPCRTLCRSRKLAMYYKSLSKAQPTSTRFSSDLSQRPLWLLIYIPRNGKSKVKEWDYPAFYSGHSWRRKQHLLDSFPSFPDQGMDDNRTIFQTPFYTQRKMAFQIKLNLWARNTHFAHFQAVTSLYLHTTDTKNLAKAH